jgi:hypothetical protein
LTQRGVYANAKTLERQLIRYCRGAPGIGTGYGSLVPDPTALGRPVIPPVLIAVVMAAVGVRLIQLDDRGLTAGGGFATRMVSWFLLSIFFIIERSFPNDFTIMNHHLNIHQGMNIFQWISSHNQYVCNFAWF